MANMSSPDSLAEKVARIEKFLTAKYIDLVQALESPEPVPSNVMPFYARENIKQFLQQQRRCPKYCALLRAIISDETPGYLTVRSYKYEEWRRKQKSRMEQVRRHFVESLQDLPKTSLAKCLIRISEEQIDLERFILASYPDWAEGKINMWQLGVGQDRDSLIHLIREAREESQQGYEADFKMCDQVIWTLYEAIHDGVVTEEIGMCPTLNEGELLQLEFGPSRPFKKQATREPVHVVSRSTTSSSSHSGKEPREPAQVLSRTGTSSSSHSDKEPRELAQVVIRPGTSSSSHSGKQPRQLPRKAGSRV